MDNDHFEYHPDQYDELVDHNVVVELDCYFEHDIYFLVHDQFVLLELLSSQLHVYH